MKENYIVESGILTDLLKTKTITCNKEIQRDYV